MERGSSGWNRQPYVNIEQVEIIPYEDGERCEFVQNAM